MNIFEAIINNNIDRVKFLLDANLASKDDRDSEFFTGKDGKSVKRSKRKTALEVAIFLGRNEIVDLLNSSLKIEDQRRELFLLHKQANSERYLACENRCK